MPLIMDQKGWRKDKCWIGELCGFISMAASKSERYEQMGSTVHSQDELQKVSPQFANGFMPSLQHQRALQ